MHGILFHSEDAGAHFAATPLAGDSYTDWPLGPTARIATHGDTHATIETFDPPQHHNGHRQTRYVFTTDDGGAHVKLVDTATQCFDEESHCQGG